MARVIAFIPDLLFGSNVLAAVSAAGHDPVLVSDIAALGEELEDAHALVVDLTADPFDRIEEVGRVRPSDLPALAFYSHVEPDVRKRAEEAGFELVVPRSRMAREGGELVRQLMG